MKPSLASRWAEEPTTAPSRSSLVETVMRADARRAAESEEWSLRGLLPFLSAILLEFE
jgi:hypothetical protein